MILFYLLLGYFLFRFVVNFLIPVFRTSRNMREQFSRMNQQQASGPGHADAGARPSSAGGPPRQPDASKVGEYIDFEEVKP